MKRNMNDELARIKSEPTLSEELFRRREYSIYHLEYGKELAFYDAVKKGDFDLVRRLMLPLRNERLGKLSENPLRNLKYHLVITVAMITRFCIEGGLPPEPAYTLSDIYIRQIDSAWDEDTITMLHREAVFDFTSRMKELKEVHGLSHRTTAAIDYIYDHLNEKIQLSPMAETLGVNKTYLCALFRRETGITVGQYIMKKKIEAAEKMLLYSGNSSAQISALLSFSSASHFIEAFKKETGLTPSQYRKIRSSEAFTTMAEK